MMKKLAIILIVGLALSVISGTVPAVAADKVLINGFDAAYPPFSFIDKAGNPAGFDIDAVNWIAKEMGFKVKHQPTDWAAIVPSLKAGKIDFIASGMSITPERQKAVNRIIHVINESFLDPPCTIRYCDVGCLATYFL